MQLVLPSLRLYFALSHEIQLHLRFSSLVPARLAQLPAATFVKRRRRRFPRSSSCASLQSSSCELPAAPSVQLHLRSLSSQLAKFSSCAVAASAFSCTLVQVPASSSLQRSSFQLQLSSSHGPERPGNEADERERTARPWARLAAGRLGEVSHTFCVYYSIF